MHIKPENFYFGSIWNLLAQKVLFFWFEKRELSFSFAQNGLKTNFNNNILTQKWTISHHIFMYIKPFSILWDEEKLKVCQWLLYIKKGGKMILIIEAISDDAFIEEKLKFAINIDFNDFLNIFLYWKDFFNSFLFKACL